MKSTSQKWVTCQVYSLTRWSHHNTGNTYRCHSTAHSHNVVIKGDQIVAFTWAHCHHAHRCGLSQSHGALGVLSYAPSSHPLSTRTPRWTLRRCLLSYLFTSSCQQPLVSWTLGFSLLHTLVGCHISTVLQHWVSRQQFMKKATVQFSVLTCSWHRALSPPLSLSQPPSLVLLNNLVCKYYFWKLYLF